MSRIGGAAVTPPSLQEVLEEDIARDERAVDGLDRGRGWKSCLKQRLGFTGIPCCGPVLGLNLMTSAAVSVADGVESQPPPPENGPQVQVEAGAGMNLAAALAAERAVCQRRGGGGPSPATETPRRVSLMGLLEGTDGAGGDGAAGLEARGGGERRIDSVCCVCMERRKDAAFVPCGHTFCRQCSKELRASRGTCPVCNRLIHQILDLF